MKEKPICQTVRPRWMELLGKQESLVHSNLAFSATEISKWLSTPSKINEVSGKDM